MTDQLDIPLVEKALLTGSWPQDYKFDTSKPSVIEFACDVVNGRFRTPLTSPAAKELFKLGPNVNDQPFDLLFGFYQTSEGSIDEEGELLRLTLAVALLHAFLQANWTGPELDVKPLEILSVPPELASSLTETILDQKAIAELAFGGEPAYHLARYPIFLRIAQLLLARSFTYCPSAAWWRLRAEIAHQQLLDEPVAPPSSVFTALETLTGTYAADPDLSGRLHLETGLLHHILSQDRSAAEDFVRAARATGLEYELTGALGKRTKFQQKDLSQLVLLAESRLTIEDDAEKRTQNATIFNGPQDSVSENKASMPETLALNDDTLLEQTQFTSSHHDAERSESRLSHLDPSSQPALHPLDQCILLSLCLNVRNTSPAHGLTAEQMSPYVARVISHPRNWSVHTMALLLRSRLESARTRTVERSTLQIQALVDQMPTADSSSTERLLYIHGLPLPSKWELERELAHQFIKIGAVRSALEIFERLEMWEDVVKCWGALSRPDKAIAIVRDLFEGRKEESESVLSRGKALPATRRIALDTAREAKLWCLLGDLEPENAVEHYQKAWAISKETSGRAMRSLGGYHFARGNYKQAITCLRKAVAINPLLARSWFVLGCACVREEAWEGAREAFTRCVAIDDEDGESWNNLASVYLRLGKQTATQDHRAPGEADGGGGDDDEVSTQKNAPDVALSYDRATAEAVPFENKLLAFRALKQGLRFSYENWRMWSNYMIVAMDVGELSEATRALGRVVQETSPKLGAKAVDEEVLDRLVDAVTRVPSEALESNDGPSSGTAVHNPHEGHGLLRAVTQLLEVTILPRVSSPRVFRAYARLLTWQNHWEDALKAYLDAYRCGVAGTMANGETDVNRWREAVSEVEEIVDVLRNFGPRVTAAGGTNQGGTNLRLQARSIVRTFVGRTKAAFEDEPEWSRLTDMLAELRKDADEE